MQNLLIKLKDPDLLNHIRPFFNPLTNLFSQVDQQYNEVAQKYGFQCTGCQDNCCETLFYHHTYLEYGYIIEGVLELSNTLAKEIINRSKLYCIEHNMSNQQPFRMMCPINEQGKCLTYTHRPLICRLHGLAHELHTPNRPVSYGPGCDYFSTLCEQNQLPYYSFDRTELYRQMAQLEQSLRKELCMTTKLKMTIASILEDAFI